MHLGGEVGDLLAEFLGQLGELGVLMHKLDELGGLLGGHGELLCILFGYFLAMQGVGIGMDLVAVGLPRLRQQDERRGVSGLETEGKVEQNERIEIKLNETCHIQPDPNDDDDALHNEKDGRPEETSKGLGFQRKPVVSENGGQVNMMDVEAEVVAVLGRTG